MRKQYYFRDSSQGLLAWDVDALVERSRNLPTRSVPLAEIRELDEPVFDATERGSWREVVAHIQLIDEAELRYPIILAADGAVMDGRHRVAKALLRGLERIDAVQFPIDPPPDHVGRHPDELPY